jgi:hypothetical protein
MVLITRPKLVYRFALCLILFLNLISFIVSWTTVDSFGRGNTPKDAVPDDVAIYLMISSAVCIIAFLLAAWVTPKADVARCPFAYCMISRYVFPRIPPICGAFFGGACLVLNTVLPTHTAPSPLIVSELGMIIMAILTLVTEILINDWELPATDEENIPLRHVQRQTNTHMEPAKP